MKKIHLIIIFFFVMFLVAGCHKKQEKSTLENKMVALATNYLSSEEKITPIDSITDFHIDTLTAMGYSKLVLEMIENMSENYNVLYREAVKNDNQEKLTYLELYKNEISNTEDFFRSKVMDETTDNKELLLFMVTADYWQKNEAHTFTIFVTPDYKIHLLDPFGDNLLLQ